MTLSQSVKVRRDRLRLILQPMSVRRRIKRIVVSLVAVYVVCHLVIGAGNIFELKSQQKALKEDLETAYSEQAALQAELEYISSDDAIEKRAREDLGLVGENEILVQID